MTVEIVSLGCWCDLDDSRPGSAWLAGTAGQTPESLNGVLDFRVEETATLSDGRRLTLTTDRGWSIRRHGAPEGDTPWAYLTAEDVEATARLVVQPDDAEETGEPHTWARLAESLQAQGVATTLERLKLLPYPVTFSRRLRERLPGAD
ncbi:hypothetical protein FAGKG844_50122 [Frankia sp. AgKG'84/4]